MTDATHAMHVDLETARADLEAGRADLLDVREPSEHAQGVAAGALLIPLSQLQQRLGEVPPATARPLHVICHTQNRSRMVVQALRAIGYPEARFVVGGMSMWTMQGWPTVRPGA